jgi:putative transposase
MKRYKRYYQPGGTYFFTVVTHGRKKILIDNIARLREAFEVVKGKMPFTIDAIVILPDHLHCIWKLPPDDSDFSGRWQRIKKHFSTGIPAPVNKRREKSVWQPRFWEHFIRNDDDWRNHMNYIHYNPVKHGYVKRPLDWEYGSFRKWVRNRFYENSRGTVPPEGIGGLDCE